MFSLPYKSIKYQVLSIRQKNASTLNTNPLNTSYLIPNINQQGIASLALIALLLIGISAGVYLTQTRTNFLPQAADSLTECSFKDIDDGKKAFSHCQFTTVGSNVEDLSRCKESSRTVVDLSTFKLWCKPISTVPAPATAPTTQAPWIKSNECTQDQKNRCASNPAEPKDGCAQDHAGKGWCLYEERRNGEKCNEDTHGALCKRLYGANTECLIIDRVSRCIVKTCSADDNASCGTTSSCTVGTKNLNGKEYSYTYCGPRTGAPATQPRPAGAPAANPAVPANRNTGSAAAPAAAAPTTNNKTPWDNDADNNGSKVIQQIYSRAAAKAGAAAQAARNPTDAATAARKAYAQEFDAAYKELFSGADIGKDNDAKTIREKELNNVTVHAYVTKTPGIDWNKAKTDGTVEKAITELKKLGVLPNTVTTASISSPDAPASAGLRQATPTECGYTADGISVPCYKVGVFTSAEDLAATKAQATQATQRYTQNEALLQEIKAKVKSDAAKAAITAAERKNAEAKKNADACLI